MILHIGGTIRSKSRVVARTIGSVIPIRSNLVCQQAYTEDSTGTMLCGDSYCTLVTVSNNPAGCHADFSVSAGTSDLEFNFHDSSQGVNPTYHWAFGDGGFSNLQNPVHQFTQAGEYEVCQMVYSHDSLGNIVCTDQFCLSVEAGNMDCMAQFIAFESAPFNISVLNGSIGENLEYEWDFGDGYRSHQENPSHTYATTGSYIVCLAVADVDTAGTVLCRDTVCQNIVINAQGNWNCSASFFYNITNGGVVFTNLSTGSGSLSSNWDFGDGTYSAQANPIHHYSGNGQFTVCLTISDYSGCITAFCDVVEISNGAGAFDVYGLVTEANTVSAQDAHVSLISLANGVYNNYAQQQNVNGFYQFADVEMGEYVLKSLRKEEN